MIRDAATSGVAEISESDVPLACAATPSRSRRNGVDEEDGCRDSASENDAATPLVEGTEVPEQPRKRIHHDVLNQSAGLTGMVGGRSREPPAQYCRPGEQAIANRQTHHEVNNELSRRLVASGAGNREPEHRHVTPVLGMVLQIQGVGWSLCVGFW